MSETAVLGWDEIVKQAKEMQKEMLELQSQLDNKKALYKAFTKEHLGLADGENTDVLAVAHAVRKVMSK